MKKYILITLFFCVALLLAACTADDITVDKTTTGDLYIMQPAALVGNLLMVNPTVPADPFSVVSLGFNVGNISQIEKFRERYYLINEGKQKIFVVDRDDVINAYETQNQAVPNLTVVDFMPQNLWPVDICFPNATDAYIAYTGSNKIGILDLTNNQLSGVEIEVAGEPTCIAGAGNQVCVACHGTNKVDIIDTRTNAVERSISIAGQPKLVEFANGGSDIVVITSGGSEGAKLFVIDVASGQITLERTLVNDAEVSKSLDPQAVVATQGTLYVACNNGTGNMYGGIRIPTSNFRTSYSMLRNSCYFVGYSSIYNTLYFVEQTDTDYALSIFNAGNNTFRESFGVDGPVVVSD